MGMIGLEMDRRDMCRISMVAAAQLDMLPVKVQFSLRPNMPELSIDLIAILSKHTYDTGEQSLSMNTVNTLNYAVTSSADLSVIIFTSNGTRTLQFQQFGWDSLCRTERLVMCTCRDAAETEMVQYSADFFITHFRPINAFRIDPKAMIRIVRECVNILDSEIMRVITRHCDAQSCDGPRWDGSHDCSVSSKRFVHPHESFHHRSNARGLRWGHLHCPGDPVSSCWNPIPSGCRGSRTRDPIVQEHAE